MAWLISRALMDCSNSPCLAAGGAESSEADCSGGELSVQSRSIDTPQAYFAPGRTMARWSRSRSGVTFEVSAIGIETAENCLRCFAESVIDSLLAGDSPARTSPLREQEQGSTESGRACGENRRGSFAKYDPDTCGWRTHQRSLGGGYIEFSETWPRWGSMRNGECYPLRMPSGLRELRQSITAGSGSGSTVKMPTLNCEGEEELFAMSHKAARSIRRKSLKVPTPRKHDGEKGAVSATETTRRRVLEGTANLPEFIQEASRIKVPTPTVQDSANNGPPSQMERNSPPLNAVVGGPLNPDWAEWLMGWPIGWTDLQPLGTDRFQQWSSSHGKC